VQSQTAANGVQTRSRLLRRTHEALPEERQEPAPLGPVHLVEQRHLVELGQEGDVALDGVAVVEHRS